MRDFFQSNSRIFCLTNIVVCVLCTGYLCTGFYQVNNNNQHEKDTVVINTETDPLSKNKEENAVVSTNTVTKTVVTKVKSNTSSKTYVQPKYDAVTGSAVVDYAKNYLGLRYVSGGNSLTTGTDCSGFTKLIYQQFGIKLSRSVKTQATNGSYVSKNDLQKGDLIFYGRQAGVVSHVAIYIGNGKVIHQSTPKDGVKIGGMNMMVYITARRVISEKSSAVVETDNTSDITPTVVETDNTGDITPTVVETDNTGNIAPTETKNDANVNDTYTDDENNDASKLPVEENNSDVQNETKVEINEIYTNSEYGTSN